MNIQNNDLRLSVTLKAAEMTSLIDRKTNTEVLWNGDPAYWAGRNPILFPIVGSTFDKKIHLFGKTTEMGNHGFARHEVFELKSQTQDSITLALSDNPTTLIQYPFRFTLSVTYTLKGRSVLIDYTITNKDEKPMPFSFGLHPAFMIDGPDDARIKLGDSDPILMNDAYFVNEPTHILEHPSFDTVDLIRKDLTVRVGFKGYRWLAFWKKPQAKFICIEPWHGHTDFGQTTTDFYAREGTIVLQPGQSFQTSYTISIH